MDLEHLSRLLAGNARVREAVEALSPEDQRWLWGSLTVDDREERVRLRDRVIHMGCALVDARELLAGASAPEGYRWVWHSPAGSGLRWEWEPEDVPSGAIVTMVERLNAERAKGGWPELEDVRGTVFYRLVPVAWLDVVADRVAVMRHPAAVALYPELKP